MFGSEYGRLGVEELRRKREELESRRAALEQELHNWQTQLQVLEEEYRRILESDRSIESYRQRIEQRIKQLEAEMPRGEVAALSGAEKGTLLRLQEQVVELQQHGLPGADKQQHDAWLRLQPLKREIALYEKRILELEQKLRSHDIEEKQANEALREQLAQESSDKQ